jgi:hypothetical protein
MTLTIITHVLAFLAGGGTVFIYLHKHQTQAIAAATSLAGTVAEVKTMAAEVKSKV